jgi:hypothetical protein
VILFSRHDYASQPALIGLFRRDDRLEFAPGHPIAHWRKWPLIFDRACRLVTPGARLSLRGSDTLPNEVGCRDEVLQRSLNLLPAAGLQPAIWIHPELLGCDRLECTVEKCDDLSNVRDAW